ncbi:MAG: HAD-IIB family hydrolase [Pseudomonadales bacterium]
MPNCSALVFDLDGTLLRRDRSVSTSNLQALLQAASVGFTLVIATSRPIRSIRQFLPSALLDLCTTISLNGAAIWSPGAGNARLLGHVGADLTPLLDALSATSHDLRYSLETDGQRFALSHPLDAHDLWTVHAATPDMVVHEGLIDPIQVTKIAVDGLGRALDEALGLARGFPALRFIPADAQTFLNIVPADVDKAPALGMVADELGLDLSASIAFGDDLPDLDLMSVVGTGIAMSNGHELVHAAADQVIGDCDEDTIADWIHRNLLS